jgi:hypothetical protein
MTEKELCWQKAAKLQPPGVDFEFNFSRSIPLHKGRIYYLENGTKARIETRPPDSREELWTLAHEYAHVVLRHWKAEWNGTPYHVREYECEQWTHNRFRDDGFLTAALTDASQDYLFWCLDSDPVLEKEPDWGLDQRGLGYLPARQAGIVRAKYDKLFEATGLKCPDYNGTKTTEIP